jgi:hypothetical protein
VTGRTYVAVDIAVANKDNDKNKKESKKREKRESKKRERKHERTTDDMSKDDDNSYKVHKHKRSRSKRESSRRRSRSPESDHSYRHRSHKSRSSRRDRKRDDDYYSDSDDYSRERSSRKHINRDTRHRSRSRSYDSQESDRHDNRAGKSKSSRAQDRAESPARKISGSYGSNSNDDRKIFAVAEPENSSRHQSTKPEETKYRKEHTEDKDDRYERHRDKDEVSKRSEDRSYRHDHYNNGGGMGRYSNRQDYNDVPRRRSRSPANSRSHKRPTDDRYNEYQLGRDRDYRRDSSRYERDRKPSPDDYRRSHSRDDRRALERERSNTRMIDQHDRNKLLERRLKDPPNNGTDTRAPDKADRRHYAETTNAAPAKKYGLQGANGEAIRISKTADLGPQSDLVERKRAERQNRQQDLRQSGSQRRPLSAAEREAALREMQQDAQVRRQHRDRNPARIDADDEARKSGASQSGAAFLTELAQQTHGIQGSNISLAERLSQNRQTIQKGDDEFM